MNHSTYFYIYLPEIPFENKERMVLYYHGPFNNGIISKMANNLKSKLNCPKHLAWKVFSVFVELVQNIYFHAVEYNIALSHEPVGVIFIEESDDYFEITAANLTEIEKIEKIREKCELINQMDLTALRAYKNELLLKSSEKSDKGGNIGLVQIAILSQEKVDFQIKSLNAEQSFFSLSALIKK